MRFSITIHRFSLPSAGIRYWFQKKKPIEKNLSSLKTNNIRFDTKPARPKLGGNSFFIIKCKKSWYKISESFVKNLMDPGRSVEWGLDSEFCQPILLHTKCTGLNNGITLHVGKILFILYENSDWKIWPLL